MFQPEIFTFVHEKVPAKKSAWQPGCHIFCTPAVEICALASPNAPTTGSKMPPKVSSLATQEPTSPCLVPL